MNVKRVTEEISFSDEKLKKNSLFDSPHLFYDAYCLLPGQSQKVHAHEGSDKIYYVLQGTGRFTIGEEEEDLGTAGGHGHPGFYRGGSSGLSGGGSTRRDPCSPGPGASRGTSW